MNDLDLLDEIQSELDDFTRQRKYKKLSFSEWVELDIQYNKTPPVNKFLPDEQFFPYGEHVILRSILNKLGYFPISRQNTLDMAYDLLILGYE